eukprot:6180935-Pleurochrysis_carterae.AAC.3
MLRNAEALHTCTRARSHTRASARAHSGSLSRRAGARSPPYCALARAHTCPHACPVTCATRSPQPVSRATAHTLARIRSRAHTRACSPGRAARAH